MKQQDTFQVTEKKLSRTNIIGLIIAVILVPSYGLVQKYIFSPPIDTQLKTIASEINKMYPIMVDDQTRLDSVLALPGKTLQYNYTFVEMETATVDSADLKVYMEPIILEHVKKDPQMKRFRDNKVTLNYLYGDKNGEYIALIRITLLVGC